MPNISVLKTSNFIKKEDCEPPILLTIDRVSEENVAKEGASPELKWCVHFREVEKPMVLNSTNGQIIAKITGSDETENWAGHKVVLYNDPSVSFGGKLTGGIRCRAPRGPANPAKAVTQPALPVEPDDVPFSFILPWLTIGSGAAAALLT